MELKTKEQQEELFNTYIEHLAKSDMKFYKIESDKCVQLNASIGRISTTVVDLKFKFGKITNMPNVYGDKYHIEIDIFVYKNSYVNSSNIGFVCEDIEPQKLVPIIESLIEKNTEVFNIKNKFKFI